MFWLWKKSETKNNVLVAPSFYFWLFQIQNLSFFTFEYIQALA